MTKKLKDPADKVKTKKDSILNLPQKADRTETETTEGEKAEYTSAELALIANYIDQAETRFSPLKFKITSNKKGDTNAELDLDAFLGKTDLMRPVIAKMTGTNQGDFALDIIFKTIRAAVNNCEWASGMDQQANVICAAMLDLEPRDGFEGMLISQMVGVYAHAVECLRMATIDSNKGSTQIHLTLHNQAVKLMRTYIAGMEALKKYRTGGLQKMTVEHIHVNQGGQAIVGNVQGGGDATKK